MKKVKISLVLVILVICIAVSSIIGVSAYIHRLRELESNTKIGHAEIISLINPTTNNKLTITEETNQNINVSINLDCNVDAVIRVKISPRYYDSAERIIILPNNIKYNFDTTHGNWIADDLNMCFYLDSTVKDLSSITIINSITFDSSTISDYQNCLLDFIIEADILQTTSIDYSNHPWKDNAPMSWLDKVKTI